jgi:hypothetical protein
VRRLLTCTALRRANNYAGHYRSIPPENKIVTETSWTYLKRVDFDKNVNRWYAVGVQPSLLDAVALVRFWGSREKNYRQVMAL